MNLAEFYMQVRLKKLDELKRKYKVTVIGEYELNLTLLTQLEKELDLKNIVRFISVKSFEEIAFEKDQLNESAILQAEVLYINFDDTDNIERSVEYLQKKYNKIKIQLPIPLLNTSSSIDQVINHTKIHGVCPPIIYQMGKVGSSSVYHSLEMKGHFGWHVHQISAMYHDWKRRNHSTEKFYNILLNNYDPTTRRRIKIITLVREPIARNMAAFFETIELAYPNLFNQFEYNRDETIRQIISHYFEIDMNEHSVPINWWGNELEEVFEVDVFSEPFPKELGYKIIRNGSVEVLVIKLEKLQECAKDAFHEFLGIPDFSLFNSNLGEKKRSSVVYKEFKKNIIFKETYLNALLDSPKVRHFYTDLEINEFKKKYASI